VRKGFPESGEGTQLLRVNCWLKINEVVFLEREDGGFPLGRLLREKNYAGKSKNFVIFPEETGGLVTMKKK